MSTAANKPSKNSYSQVAFYWDSDNQVQAYTDWSADVEDNGISYTSEPGLEVALGTNSATLEEEETLIHVPIGDAFTTALKSTLPHAPIRVEIVEKRIAVAGSAPSVRTIPFIGEVVSTTPNPSGKSGVITVACLPLKGQMAQVALGWPCNHQCINRFGDSTCKAIVPSVMRVVASMSGNVLEFTADLPDAPPGSEPNSRVFQRGYVAYQGLNLGIKDSVVSGNLNQVLLVRRAPASWAGQTVTVLQGCDKTFFVCHGRYNNATNFNGLGIGLPDYHPSYEQPRGDG